MIVIGSDNFHGFDNSNASILRRPVKIFIRDRSAPGSQMSVSHTGDNPDFYLHPLFDSTWNFHFAISG